MPSIWFVFLFVFILMTFIWLYLRTETHFTFQIDVRKFRVQYPWMIGYWLSPEDASIPLTSNIITGNMYPTSFTFFDHVKDDIRKIFRFRTHFREHAEGVFSHVKRIRPWTQVFVCVSIHHFSKNIFLQLYHQQKILWKVE